MTFHLHTSYSTRTVTISSPVALVLLGYYTKWCKCPRLFQNLMSVYKIQKLKSGLEIPIFKSHYFSRFFSNCTNPEYCGLFFFFSPQPVLNNISTFCPLCTVKLWPLVHMYTIRPSLQLDVLLVAHSSVAFFCLNAGNMMRKQ